MYVPKHQLFNKAAGFNAKLAPARLGPFQTLDHVAGDVYLVWKDNIAQKVHGSTLIPAPQWAATEEDMNEEGATEQVHPTLGDLAGSVGSEE